MQSVIIETPVNVEERKKLDLRSGDTVRVHQRIKEGDKTRLQVFEGFVIARKHGREAGGTFTVRKLSGGVGIERIFPLYSPVLEKIEVIKRSKTRRAKLYFVREKAVKELRRRQKQVIIETVQRVGFDEDLKNENVKNEEAADEKKIPAEQMPTTENTQEIKQEAKNH